MFDLIALEKDALDILNFDGEIADTLAELRKKWGQDIPALFDQRFDDVAMQYMTFEHEDGIQALGQELTAFGWCLYDFDEEDEHLFILLSDKEKAAFEQQCRKADHYFKLMKQRGRAFGQAAKEQPTQPLMPCNDTYFPQDAYYTIQTIAGNFASGIWIAKDEIQQGKFVADLRERPLKPIKVNWEGFHGFTYSPKLDFYAAIYTTMYAQMIIGGKDAASVNDWGKLTPRSMRKLNRLYWCNDYLCTGDEESVLILKMNESGVEDVQRFILSPSDSICRFAIDGLGHLYINRGHSDSEILRYENRDLQCHPFRRSGYDELDNSLPVFNTSRLLMIRETSGWDNNHSNLLDLDMMNGCCKIVPLPGLGENLKLRSFINDWVIIYNSGDDFRTDFAQLWNQKSGEILRIRPGMFASCKPSQIAALPDGRIIITTLHTKVGSVIHESKDFWGFLRLANKPKHLGKWRRYHSLYPDIPRTLPANQQLHIKKNQLVICGKKLIPPFTLEKVTEILGTARIVTKQGARKDSNTNDAQLKPMIYYVWDNLGIQGQVNNNEIENFIICLSRHDHNLAAKSFDGNVLINGRDYIETEWETFGSINTLKLGCFTIFTCLPRCTLENNDEKLKAIIAYYASHIKIYYTPVKLNAKSLKYKLPKGNEPLLKFKNLNFKLAVMNVLMYEKNLIKPKFNIWEFASEYTQRKIDPETEGYDKLIPEAADWFMRYPIPARLASEITEINMDGGDEINCQLAPNWDGEDSLFDIDAIDENELRQFPKLKQVSIFTTNEYNVVSIFRKLGIKVVSAYDIPFEMDTKKI